MADANKIHLLWFIIEAATNGNKKTSTNISLDLTKFISTQHKIIGALSALYFADYSTMNQELVEFMSNACQKYEVLNRWFERKIEPVKDALRFSKQVELKKALKKFSVAGIGHEHSDSLYLAVSTW